MSPQDLSLKSVNIYELVLSSIFYDDILERALSLEIHENMTHPKYKTKKKICGI